MTSLLFLALAFAQPALSQTTIVGDYWVGKKFAVGIATPTAQFEVRASTANLGALQVSGLDGTPLLYVSSASQVGAGTLPLANLDINGSADSGANGLMLRSGLMSPSTGTYQMVFGFNGSTNMSDAIRTQHSTSAVAGTIQFLLWRTSESQSAVGDRLALALVDLSTGASVHICPAGAPTVQLEVSDCSTTGGGTIHRAAEGTFSSRALKANISYLGPEAGPQAYQEVLGLKHVEFRYKSLDKYDQLVRDTKQPLRRGIIYEESPSSIRGPGESVMIDDRVNNLEMAEQELFKELESTEAEADKAGGGP